MFFSGKITKQKSPVHKTSRYYYTDAASIHSDSHPKATCSKNEQTLNERRENWVSTKQEFMRAQLDRDLFT